MPAARGRLSGRSADFPSRRDYSIDDAGVAGTAADLAAEFMTNGLGIGLAITLQDIPAHDEHPRRAKTALQGVALMEVPAQHLHHGIDAQPFEGLNGTAVAHDRQLKT